MGKISEWFAGRDRAEAPAQASAPAAAEPPHPVDSWLTRSTAPAPAILPPPREPGRFDVTTREAVGLSAVFRSFEVLAGSVVQLSVDVERDGRRLPASAVHPLIRRPSLDMDRETFFEQTAVSMAAAGNAYWLRRRGPDGDTVALDLLNPHEVHPGKDKDGRRVYRHKGDPLTDRDVVHLPLLMLPGAASGLGPIQACRAGLAGALDTRDYAARVFGDNGGTPSGILSTDQVLNAEDAQLYRNGWNNLDPEGNPLDVNNPSRVKVLGKGLAYEPILLKPEDAQWIESQKFSVTDVARMFGMPASLLLATVDGGSMTYQNIGQEWLGYVRFTMMRYLRRIELALTELVPRGQTVRFNVETLLRTDTTTRYAAHKMALDSGWMDDDEVRAIENMPPLTPEQRERIAARPKATTTPTAGEPADIGATR